MLALLAHGPGVTNVMPGRPVSFPYASVRCFRAGRRSAVSDFAHRTTRNFHLGRKTRARCRWRSTRRPAAGDHAPPWFRAVWPNSRRTPRRSSSRCLRSRGRQALVRLLPNLLSPLPNSLIRSRLHRHLVFDALQCACHSRTLHLRETSFV